MRLYQAFPQPSPVTLGGRRYLALPLRVKHLAAIETFLASQVPDPSLAYRGAIAAADEEERKFLAAEAYLLAEDWPPKASSPEGERLLNTPVGLQLFLAFTIGPCNVLCDEDYLHIFANIAPDEYRALCSLAYGLASLDELSLAIEPPDEAGPPQRSWGEVIYRMCDGKPDALLAIEDMFITQVSLLRSEGKAGDGFLAGTTKQRRQARRSLFAEARRRLAERGVTLTHEPPVLVVPDSWRQQMKRTASSCGSRARNAFASLLRRFRRKNEPSSR